MHDRALVLARPKGSDQLILLFQGVYSSVQDLITLGSKNATNSNQILTSVGLDRQQPAYQPNALVEVAQRRSLLSDSVRSKAGVCNLLL